MTYLWILRLLDRLLRRCENVTDWWTFTNWRGHVAFRQIDYAKRVQKASGWEPVEVVTLPSMTTSGPMSWTIEGPGTWTTGVITAMTDRYRY